MQSTNKKAINSHYFKSTTTRDSFALMDRTVPVVTATETFAKKEVSQVVKSVTRKESKNEKLSNLVGKSMWDLVNLEKKLVPTITSKISGPKYDLKDTFFRKAFIKKPKVS